MRRELAQPSAVEDPCETRFYVSGDYTPQNSIGGIMEIAYISDDKEVYGRSICWKTLTLPVGTD